MTTQVEAPTTFRWDRLTYSSALGYCLLVAGLSVGVVLSELRDEFGISGVVAALHGSTFGIGLLFAGVFGVKLVDRVGRRQVLTISAACLAGGARWVKETGAAPRLCRSRCHLVVRVPLCQPRLARRHAGANQRWPARSVMSHASMRHESRVNMTFDESRMTHDTANHPIQHQIE